MKTWISLSSLLFSGLAWGAACCGTNSAVPALLSGPDQSQVTASLAFGQVVADATPNGKLNPREGNDSETAQNFTLSAATLLSDRWQGGVSLPVNRRARNRSGSGADHAGVGDLALDVAWEFLPNWSYSRWRPQGYVFTTVTLPTGGSRYESSELYSVDSHGSGFLRLGLGVLLLKSWGPWDTSLVAEVHRALPRTIENSGNSFELTPGWGASALVGAGYAPRGTSLRLGLAVGPQIDDGVRVGGPAPLDPVAERVWTTTLIANYFFNMEWTATLSYGDQSWLGNAQNTGVRRVALFSLQRRWPR